MSRHRALLLVLVAGVAVVTWWWGHPPDLPPAGDVPPPPPRAATPTAQPAAPLTKEARAKLLRDAPEAHLADNLNLPDGDIRSDLAMVGSMIAAYRSIYSGKGNPIGDNREITDTLLGQNPNGIIFLQSGHRAINDKGELCDRWGTPFFFHAESGRRMEVRSAGPDRKRWTDDDVFLVP